MAYTVITVSAEQLKSGITPTGLEDRTNAALAALLNDAITSVQIQAGEKQRRGGKIFEIGLTYDVGAVVIANPFRLVTFTGATQAAAQALATAYRAANPTYFFSEPYYRYIQEFAPATTQPHVIFQFYSEDATAEDNWQVGGGGGGGAALTADVTAALDVGAIDAGETLAAGTTFQQFVESLLVTTFDPTFTAPTANLTDDQPAQLEVGTITDILLTMVFDRGSIDGDLVAGVWNPAVAQDFRAGAATSYIIDGVNTALVNNRTLVGESIALGANTYNATVNYAEGPQPLDSDGNNFGAPLAAGLINDDVTITGVRAAFYGVSAAVGPAAPANSAEVRALGSTLLNPVDGSTFTINIPIGTTMVVFSYPDTLPAVESVLYVEGFDADVKGNFTETTVAVEGANAFAAIDYRVYTYIPVEAFDAEATYNVTI